MSNTGKADPAVTTVVIFIISPNLTVEAAMKVVELKEDTTGFADVL